MKEDAAERQVRKRHRIILLKLKRQSDQLFPNETEQNAADLQRLRNKERLFRLFSDGLLLLTLVERNEQNWTTRTRIITITIIYGFKADGRVHTNTTRTTATAVVSEHVGIQNDS